MIRILSTACLALFAALLIWVVVGRDNRPGFAGNLYQTRAIVTGEREETRLLVLGQCLKDVLKRVSGDPVIDRDPRVEAFASQAQAYRRRWSGRDTRRTRNFDNRYSILTAVPAAVTISMLPFVPTVS